MDRQEVKTGFLTGCSINSRRVLAVPTSKAFAAIDHSRAPRARDHNAPRALDVLEVDIAVAYLNSADWQSTASIWPRGRYPAVCA